MKEILLTSSQFEQHHSADIVMLRLQPTIKREWTSMMAKRYIKPRLMGI